MKKKLAEKIREALSSVLPITAIVLLLSFTLAPLPVGTMMMFLMGAVMLIVGMGFFSLGADIAMMPMGDAIGGQLAKSKKVGGLIAVCLLIGVAITVAEPDLQVLARQVPAVPDLTIIVTVAVGVGVFLVLAAVRSLLKIPLRWVLLALYAVVFLLAFFIPKEFLAVAFDSGGVTTGPITVPFIMALGMGMASMRGNESSQEDSFGVIALCSIGPILAVMLMGLAFQSTEIAYTPFEIPDMFTSQDVAREFAHGLPEYLKEVALGLLPILVFFAVFQVIALRMRRKPLLKILVGVAYTLIGLVLFLTGVNVGFMPAGYYLGSEIAALPYRYILIPLGMVVGYFIVAAEPAVHVLNRQVEEITEGAIPQRAISLGLSVGVACSVGIAMIRVLTGISIFWFLIPGYGIALALSFFVPRIFTAIAFDSGGVASGPMTAAFLLPFTMGACDSMGGNILTDAFGIVAMVAMTPLVTIQIIGLFYKLRQKKNAGAPAGDASAEVPALRKDFVLRDDIVDYTSMDATDEPRREDGREQKAPNRWSSCW